MYPYLPKLIINVLPFSTSCTIPYLLHLQTEVCYQRIQIQLRFTAGVFSQNNNFRETHQDSAKMLQKASLIWMLTKKNIKGNVINNIRKHEQGRHRNTMSTQYCMHKVNVIK